MSSYGVYFANPDTGDRHHIHKGSHPTDLPDLARKARWILEGMSEKRGEYWRLHGGWSTCVEIWEIHYGPHDSFTSPDRVIASARWGDADLTIDVAAVTDAIRQARASGVRLPASMEFDTDAELLDWLRDGEVSV